MSISVSITVALLVTGAVLALVFFTVFLGNEIKTGISDYFGDSLNDMNSGILHDLASGISDYNMPSATAYNILKLHERVFTEVYDLRTGEVKDILREDLNLRENLTGRLDLEVINIEGRYYAFIHDEVCEWDTGSCTCGHSHLWFDFRSYYGLN